MASRPWLVVTGEVSGDRLGAAVLRAHGGAAWGVGGLALRGAGLEVVFAPDRLSANGLGDALAVVPAAASALATIASRVRRELPSAALLVDFTSFNARLGRWLRRQGVPVLWLVAPQTWAWRPERAPALARSMDALATLFSFEVEPWRRLGVEARWVGHPAVESPRLDAAVARAALGLPPATPALALLPGSRAGEVRRLAPTFLEAARRLRRSDGVHARMLLAPGLPPALVAALTRQAGDADVQIFPTEGDASRWLPAFDAALCASGTASLQCALAGTAPVVAYRVDALTAWAARRWLRVEHVALPNVLLGRRVFPELLQERATPEALALEARRLLTAGRPEREAEALRALLDPGDGKSVGERVAAMLGELVSAW